MPEAVIVATAGTGRRIVARRADGRSKIVAFLPAPCHAEAFLNRAEKRDGEGFGHRRIVHMALIEYLARPLCDGCPERADLHDAAADIGGDDLEGDLCIGSTRHP